MRVFACCIRCWEPVYFFGQNKCEDCLKRVPVLERKVVKDAIERATHEGRTQTAGR